MSEPVLESEYLLRGGWRQAPRVQDEPLTATSDAQGILELWWSSSDEDRPLDVRLSNNQFHNPGNVE